MSISSLFAGMIALCRICIGWAWRGCGIALVLAMVLDLGAVECQAVESSTGNGAGPGPPGPPQPGIIAQPVNQTTVVGQYAVFTVGSYATSWHWQISTNGGKTWSQLSDDETYSGTATDTLTVGNTTLRMSRNQFRCKLNAWGAPIDTDAAELTVTLLTTKTATVSNVPVPQIITEPSATTIRKGRQATFMVQAAGVAALHYQWQKGGVNMKNGRNISGAMTSRVTITGATAADVGNYMVVVTVTLGKVTKSTTSGPAALTVN